MKPPREPGTSYSKTYTSSWFPYIWLIYLVVPIFYLIRLPGDKAAIGLSLVALFTVFYVLGFRRRAWSFPAALAMTAIAAGLALLSDAGMITIGFFIVALAVFQTQFWQTLAVMAAMAAAFSYVLIAEFAVLSPDEWASLLPPIGIMLAFPFVMRAIRRSRELRKQLDTANERIRQLIQQEERERIARDLHDTLGQTLTLISLKSEIAGKLVTRQPERAREELREIHGTARTALRQIRELVTDMRALRLADELDRARQLLHSANIACAAEGFEDEGAVHPLEAHVLAYALRETVTNVVRHSGASRCEIALSVSETELALIVRDDGKGLPEAEDGQLRAGNGLRNMRERLSFLGGRFEAATQPDGGSRFAMHLPVASRGEAESQSETKEGVAQDAEVSKERAKEERA
ncbi:sensor histidine kinase [Cohnella sp. REN36]|uniref:sensor histidine kinase n=1 Tax=Cohnella sp. REN36 TaxID=2887347 RepID=UPI001D155D3E|nr:sensor histidine kinase [Cohnella sp. REN36]MCC3376463.1 sensor histidine kinase [Cohnella sp. REN36]